MENTSQGARVAVAKLEAFCEEACAKAGLQLGDARCVASVLATTDSWGTFTHGSKQLRGLLRNFREGKMELGGVTEIAAEGPSWTAFDGHRSMPIVSSRIAMEKAIEKAKATGIAVSTLRNSGHFGAAGYYANLAAQAGCIGLAMCNVDPGVAVPGSRVPVLGTDPLSYAVPLGGGRTVFLDIATSIVAAGKIYRAQAEGKPIPPDWLLDKDGRPTTDPSGYPRVGAIMPMAGYKGYGIALMIEILTGVLAGGGAWGKGVKSWVMGPEPVNQSMCFIAVDIAAFMPLPAFVESMESFAREIRESPKAVGVDRIYLPGEMEWDRRDEALRAGIALPADVLASLKGLAEDFGLDYGALLR